jgi:hypothetical protein
VPWPRFTQERELLRFGERVEAVPLDAAELALWDEAATVK